MYGKKEFCTKLVLLFLDPNYSVDKYVHIPQEIKLIYGKKIIGDKFGFMVTTIQKRKKFI